MARLVWVTLVNLLLVAPVWAGDLTEAGTAWVTPGPALLAGSPQMTVTVPYAGDGNGNLMIKIEWGEEGVGFTDGSHVSALHPASPYSFDITGLDNAKLYQVRVTFQDVDNGGDPVQVIGALRPYNQLLHNAVTTGSGSSKWASGWGTADASSQYGEFACATCHDRSSGNIKRIRSNWSDAGLPAVPAKVNAVTTVFDSNVDGTAQYALDDATDHATSNRICESCHTLTAHHRYDESTTPGNPDHSSSSDCVGCHKHRSAFGPPGCSSCHGGGMPGATERNFWPDAADEAVDNAGSENDSGEHLIHMTRLAAYSGFALQELLDHNNSKALQIALCARCHPNPGGDSSHYQKDDVGDVTAFQRMDGAADAGTAGAYEPVSATCSNVDCHNGKDVAAANNWYAGSSSGCLMCHTAGPGNAEAVLDPSSGLHYSATPNGAPLHDDSFSTGGTCTSCHTATPSSGHFNSVPDATDGATFAFQSSASIDVKLNSLADAGDDTCAADCHSDGGNWHRFWSADAFDGTVVDITQPLPARCSVCHGVFGAWAAGSSHAGTFGGTASTVSQSHNNQNSGVSPGAACVDCHVDGAGNHGDNLITLNNDPETDPELGTDIDPIETVDGTYCVPCHTNSPLPPASDSEVIPGSNAFDTVHVDGGPNYPVGSCFSGAQNCHGDTSNNWWPEGDDTDPAQWNDGTIWRGYPNRAGAHAEHNLTIGTLIAETLRGAGATPGQDDYNATCRFCHPMVQEEGLWKSIAHRDGRTDLYGGYDFPTANAQGIVSSGDPSVEAAWNSYDVNGSDGYLYQLDDPFNPGSLYPIDTDGQYRQYLYGYRTDPAVNHGTCSNIACHSNAPFTPNWYRDEQPPAAISDLVASTDMQDAAHDFTEFDVPGTVHLYWSAPGDNGDFDGTAYEYEVYYSDGGPITDLNLAANLASGTTKRAGGADSVLRYGEAQEMVVDGLTPETPYYFAVVTKDQPAYKDTDQNGIYETFVGDGNRSPVAATGPVPAHTDDVAPTFWGTNQVASHDTGGAVNLSWDAAKDHTLPITYLVYWSDYSLKTHLAYNGALPILTKPAQYNGGVYSFGFTKGTSDVDPPTPGGTDYYIYASTATGLSYQATGLNANVLYNFLVRAEDGHDPIGDGTGIGNIDGNTVVAMAMAKEMDHEAEITNMNVLSGNTGMVETDPVNPLWGSIGTATLANTESVILTAATDLDNGASREMWLHGISVDMTVTNDDRKLAQAFTIELGHDTDGFTVIGSPVTVGIGRKATRVMKIGLSSAVGPVPADANLALRITSTVPSSGSIETITFDWGDDTLKGQLMVTIQPVNHEPSAAALVVDPPVRGPGGYVDIKWTPSDDGTPSDGGQTLHYDIFGSADDGATWPYVLGTNLTDADAGAGVRWDTVGDGLDRLNGTGIFNCRVKIEASDGYSYELTPGSDVWTSHRETISGMFEVDNSQDDEAPAAVYIDHIEPRPKQGGAYLHWIAVGNDGYNHGTRAAYYDIRFRKTADGDLAANWDAAGTVQVEGEPVPGFSGTAETYELLNMTPDTSHSVAIVTCDAGLDDIAGNGDDNCSGLSNVYTITSGQYACGLCHSTPPDEPDTKGTHREHGYTLEDCAMCHGDGTGPDDGVGKPGPNDVTQYDGRHYDGVINIGWAKDSFGDHLMMAKILPADTSAVSVDQGSGVIYSDPDGAGGYNSGGAYTLTANTDSGRCMNFIGANASGCHGPFTPQWAPDTVESSPAAPTCADCHGSKEIVDDLDPLYRGKDPYGRTWDDNVDGDPSDDVMASPPTANHGGTTTDDRYVGAHELHLNSSFRFAKGDSCRLCHKDTMELGLHADGDVQVFFDAVVDKDELGADVDQNHPTVDTVGASCSNMNNAYCHDGDANWAEPGAKCNSCHGMAGKDYVPGDPDSVDKSNYIGHVWDRGVARECTHCHVAGHPQSPNGLASGDPDALLVNNNVAIGINYRSGGIHLRQHPGNPDDPNGAVAYRTTYSGGPIDTLAETCWGCHEDPLNNISEWDTNTSAATGNSAYNFGTLSQTAWTGAIWESGHPVEFAYKKGYIQSTHSTDPTGTSEVVWDAANGRYNETPDPVDRIRCSNCHDVHDSNLAPGDAMTGRPYLRGTWMSNPYEEDGAPYNKPYTQPVTDPVTTMGAVPRGMVEYNELGGFYIDQNNVVPGTGASTQVADHYPTSGWTVQSSAGLCVICHGDDIEELDQRVPDPDLGTPGDENPEERMLWLGENGHSNSVLGGDFSKGANIFDFTHGRPAPVLYNWGKARPTDTSHYSQQVPDMAYTTQGEEIQAGGGYRGEDGSAGGYLPLLTNSQPYAYNHYNWGASLDGGLTDNMYHQFSCSKCHNPHASRLPKLMITNCLDIRHNTWDDANSSLQNTFTASALDAVDRNMPAAYYASAQNCHRFDPARTGAERGGWNRVTPWVKSNDTGNPEHKGTRDTSYGDTSPTYHKFPTEATGW